MDRQRDTHARPRTADLVLLGLNHRTAPVQVREKLAFAEAELPEALRGLVELEGIEGAVILSTCNRTEVLTLAYGGPAAAERIADALSRSKGIERSDFEKHLYRYEGAEAIRHLFRVAASLDSMVVGEPQILGQVKNAYKHATSAGTSGPLLNRLMHRAFRVAKRVRTETGVAENAVSISYAAVRLAISIFGDLTSRTALLVGAGEMGELAARHLVGAGVKRLLVATRTYQNAIALSERLHGEPVEFASLRERLPEADVVISATGATSFVLTHDDLKAAMKARRRRPMFLIDIALPRDIEPRANRISGVYLYDLDALEEVVEENKEARRKEALRADEIIAEETERFTRFIGSLQVVPTIIDLQQKFEAIRTSEIERLGSGLRDLSPEEMEAVEQLTLGIVNKILHTPITNLKGNTPLSHQGAVEMVRRLFELDEKGGPAAGLRNVREPKGK